jgi:alpha-galactosidase
MARLKIVFVGGGSVAWTPNIVKDLLLTPALSDAEYVLYDINKAASDLTKAYLDKLCGELGVKPTITSTDQRAVAFKKANYIVITVSTGGLDAMAHDLKIPQSYSIYHTVGDTAGPGGWARLIRNFAPFVSMAQDINRYAPGAVVLNYTNPMATLTDVLSRICDGPVVGLCHGLFESLWFIKRYYKVESEDDIAVRYAGINHGFWIDQAKVRGKDVIPELRKVLEKKSFTDLLAEIHKDSAGHSSPKREVATELFRQTGLMPYLGDRHICEWYNCYITDKKQLERYGIIRTSIADRRRNFKRAQTNIKKMIKGAIPEDRKKRSRETAADIINAHSQGKVFIDVGNVPNIGQIANLPLGAVVETAVRVDANGFSPIAFGELPDQVVGMIEPHCQVYQMVVDACFEGDKELALQALRLDPVSSHLNGKQVREMGERLLKAHAKFIPMFK